MVNYLNFNNIFQDPTINYHDYRDLYKSNQEYREFVINKLEAAKQRGIYNNTYLNDLIKEKRKHSIIGPIITLEYAFDYYNL